MLTFSTFMFAQVGVGTFNPDPSAELEVKSSNKGVLLPRVDLTSLTVFAPIVGSGTESLLVYNQTENAAAGLTKGYYFWKNNQWQKLSESGDVVATVIQNFSTIVADTNVLNQLISIIQANETVTNLVDNGNGTITYTNEDGVAQTVDIAAIVAANETVTTLVNNGNGVYTYTNEAGTTTTINVPADVISNFNTILADTNVTNQLITLIHNNGGNVYYDGSVFTYLDSSGNIVTIDFTTIVTDNETLTTLVDNGDGTITYTDEDGGTTILNIGAIAGTETVTNLVDNGDGTITYTNENAVAQTVDIAAIVAANETVTTLVDNGNGTFTYTNEAAGTTTINYNANNWNLLGNATTATDFLGTTNNQPLVLKTNNAERVRLTPAGNLGVGTATPLSSFETAGSVAGSIVVQTSNYTATANDYAIVYRQTGTATLTLPVANTCPGRKYFIINNGQTTLNISPGVEMAFSLNATTLSNGVGVQAGVVYGNRMLIQSDGTNWVLIQN